MARILISGKNGQLAKSFIEVLAETEHEVWAAGRDELDITQHEQLENAFISFEPEIFINCAAYTAVDQAEEDEDVAYAINSKAVFEIGTLCKEYQCVLIHFSTDYVYDNGQNYPLEESHPTRPNSIYGKSKREGEKALELLNGPFMIFRVSWLYSPWGNNFVKTMLQLSEQHPQLKVVNDQIGSPTYAPELARDIVSHVLPLKNDLLQGKLPLVYNYSNEGVCSWYDFAEAIFEIFKIDIKVHPVPTSEFPRPATRPHFSVMNKSLFSETFGSTPRHWRKALKECKQNLTLS